MHCREARVDGQSLLRQQLRTMPGTRLGGVTRKSVEKKGRDDSQLLILKPSVDQEPGAVFLDRPLLPFPLPTREGNADEREECEGGGFGDCDGHGRRKLRALEVCQNQIE